MKKLLSIASVFMITNLTTTFAIGCGENSVSTKLREKVALTNENIATFYKEFNSLDYTGEFFFEDKKTITPAERTERNDWLSYSAFPLFINRIYNYLYLEALEEKFYSYFDVDPETIYIYFNFESDPKYPEIEFNKKYTFSPPIYIHTPVGYNGLTGVSVKHEGFQLNFIETKQYDPQTWLERWLDFNDCWDIKTRKIEHFGAETYHPYPTIDIADPWTTPENIADELISIYRSNDPSRALEFINKGLLQDDRLKTFQENKILIKATNYIYQKDDWEDRESVSWQMMGTRHGLWHINGVVTAQLDLTFSYVDESLYPNVLVEQKNIHSYIQVYLNFQSDDNSQSVLNLI